MKTIYILLTRSGTLLSKLVYSVTGANYTHASLAFDEDLSCLYSSTRKNGYTMFPAGPSREYLDRGVFRLRPEAPCALYALEVSEEAYIRARRRANHMMAHGKLYRFNVLGLVLCAMHIRWQRRRHYFCSQFVSDVLEKSGALELPKDSTLMHPNDYTQLGQLRCVYEGRAAVRPAAAPENGPGPGPDRDQHLPWAGTGPCEGRRAADFLKKLKLGVDKGRTL